MKNRFFLFFRLKHLCWYSFYLSYLYACLILRIVFIRKSAISYYKVVITNFKQGFKSVNIYNNFPDMFKKKRIKIVVYTCLYGKYDLPKRVKKRSPYCDYYIFTDQDVPKKSGWIKMDYSFDGCLKNLTNAEKNRYIKMHPHLLFPNYDYSLYIDSKFEIEDDVFSIMGRMGNKIFGFFKHVQRDCIYDEAKMCLVAKNEKIEKVKNQMDTYKSQGFPKHYGLTENSIIIRNHTNPVCIKVMEEWWNEFINNNYSKRDQLSFMYVLWKNGLDMASISLLGDNFTFDKRFKYCYHLSIDPKQKKRYKLYIPNIGQVKHFR